MSNYFDPGVGAFVVVDGNIVERDALYIVEKIKDYDPNLELLCLDPSLAGVNDAPFILCERKPDGTLVRVLEAWSLDDRIIERIYASDTRRTDVLAALIKKEEDVEKANQNRYREMREEKMDIVKSVVKNKKSSYTFENTDGDTVTLYDDRPAQKKVTN